MSVELSVVVPVCNEEDTVPALWKRLAAVLAELNMSTEVLFINDGSTDRTLSYLEELATADRRITVIDLSRNFGKEAALSCGFREARGMVVVAMDGDLQHPPELLPKMLNFWRQGYEMVYAVRHDRHDQSPLTRSVSRAFYWVFEHFATVPLPRDAGDFRLLDRGVVDALNGLPERTRFLKGMYSWLGFRTAAVEFAVEARGEGTTKFSFFRRLALAADALTSFSRVPLRMWAILGGAISLVAFFYIVVRLLRVLFYGIDVPGYESILMAVLFLGGMQLLSLGIIGEYLGRVFDETKQRPLYVVRRRFNVAGGGTSGGADHHSVRPLEIGAATIRHLDRP